MRSIWKGAVSFGLVSITVKLYSATEEKDIRFHQIHAKDGGRIRYTRTCQLCGEEVSYDDLAKGYDLGGGEMVVLTDDDFADLPLATSHAIDVLEFVPADQVDPILYAKAYYLEPDGAATKPYVLLREALANTDRVAIVKVALRQREQLATLRVRENVLVLNTMLWPDEVRKPDFGFLDHEVDLRPAELAMAGSLIESMAADFEPREYTDNYRAALQEVIAAKVAGREVVEPAEVELPPTPAVDLMAALRASVDRARAARGENSDERAGEGSAGKAGDRAGEGSAGKAGENVGERAGAGGGPAEPARKAPSKRAAPAAPGKQTPPAAAPRKRAPTAAARRQTATATARTQASTATAGKQGSTKQGSTAAARQQASTGAARQQASTAAARAQTGKTMAKKPAAKRSAPRTPA